MLAAQHRTWQILCATYTMSDTRAAEALNAIAAFQSYGVNVTIKFLGHPDDRFDFTGGIDTQLLEDQISHYSSWAHEIITHNAAGEYGHYAHQSIHTVVHRVYPQSWNITYQEKPNFQNAAWVVPLDSTYRERKLHIFRDCYRSQQILWDKMPQLMRWAFFRESEVFIKKLHL